jgi:hypothetical protein
MSWQFRHNTGSSVGRIDYTRKRVTLTILSDLVPNTDQFPSAAIHNTAFDIEILRHHDRHPDDERNPPEP